jgi:hypothetical protein
MASKLSIKAKLHRLRSNESLDRPLISPFNFTLAFLSLTKQGMTLSLREACLTLELTGRETLNQAFNLANDMQADSAPVE